jgi:Asp-tRNA(Asn)/Glu-tRNA(Gln) amidotransferase A subunit family amidase
MITTITAATALEQAALVRSGEVSAVELVESALAEIERRAELNAFVTLAAEGALAEAARVRPDDPRPLCGVPIGIKDLVAETEGMPATHGSAAFPERIPDRDSAHVARLRAAGAIVVGRTNTPELGLLPYTAPRRHGPTLNPRDPRLNPGGSSGGSAAAVAAGLVALCDGSDVGGSVRIPAACCGVVGVKPSAGRVPNGPALDGIGTLQVWTYGAIAGTVADAATALGAMAGVDSFPVSGRAAVRVALDAPLGVPVDPEPRAAAERAAALLSDLGHAVREEAPDWDDDRFTDAWNAGGTACMRDIIQMIGGVDPDRLEPESRAWLLDGPPVSREAYGEAMGRLFVYGRRILDAWPPDSVLLTPTLTCLPDPANEPVRFSAFVRVFNVTGQPAITVPVTDTTGVQIVAAPGRDDLVLSVAARLEEALR